MGQTESQHAMDERTRRRSIGFLNWAHFLDHYVILIFPTVVIGLEAVYGRSYGDLLIPRPRRSRRLDYSRSPPAGLPTSGAGAT
jgi:hypothetical protein